MFSKLAALTFVVPLVSALTLDVPKAPTSGGQTTITWTTQAGDPTTFTLELLNPSFHDSFAIGNNVVSSDQSLTLQLPIVPPGDGYTLEAVMIGNIGMVYSTSGSFSVGAQSSSTTTSSSSSSSSSSSTGKSSSSSPSKAASASSTTSGFGVTSTAPSTSITPAGSGSSTPTTSTAAASSSAAHFNAASTLEFRFSTVSTAVLLLSAIAGTAVMML